MKKNYMLILDDEFIQYCKLNEIEDLEKFAKEVFSKGFIEVKYGKPLLLNKDEVMAKWQQAGFLNDLNHSVKSFELFKANTTQKIQEPNEKEKDIYDE